MAEGEKAAGEGGEAKQEPKEGAPSMIGIQKKPGGEPEAKAAEKKEPEAKKEPAKPEAHALGDDDEIPEDASLLQLSKPALAKRLARHTKSELKERFGTDDPEQIKSDLAELAVFRSEKEATRIANLSEVEKAKEAQKAAEKRADDAEKKAQKAVDSQVFSEYDREAATAVGEHVAPKFMKFAIRALKEHVLTLDEDELAKPEKVFAAWAKDFVKENPELALQGAPEPKKIALNTGGDPNARREKSPLDMATKVPTPGKPNSMSKGEYAQYKRQRGLS